MINVGRRIRRLYRMALTDPYQIADAWRKEGLSIGDGTAIYRDVRFGRGGKDPIVIGKNCVLTGCIILGHDASTNHALGIQPGQPSIRRTVTIEDECFIGYGAIVLMGVTIGKGSIVGAGAVVTKDVRPNTVVGGNPANIICTVEELAEKRRELAISQFSYLQDVDRQNNTK